jgi:hypothetical protein
MVGAGLGVLLIAAVTDNPERSFKSLSRCHSTKLYNTFLQDNSPLGSKRVAFACTVTQSPVNLEHFQIAKNLEGCRKSRP